MSGWEVGDLAVCVEANGPKNGYGATEGHKIPRKGAITKVEKIVSWRGKLGLVLEGFHSSHPTRAWLASAFRKIKPDTEPCEEEFTVLIKRGRKVSA